MKKLLYFDDVSLYDDKKCSLPNKVISFIKENKTVNVIEGKEIETIYVIDSTTEETKLLSNGLDKIKYMIIDNKKVNVVSDYTFNSIGEHKIIYGVDRCGENESPSFLNITSLKEVILPSNTIISTFYGCSNLDNIEINYDGSEEINFADVFTNCSSLQEFKFPNCKYGFNSNSFKNCNNLKKLIFQGGGTLPYDYSFGYYLDSSNFSGLTNLEEVIFENGFEVKLFDSFETNTNLKKIFIGDKVSTIVKSYDSYGYNSMWTFSEKSLEEIIVDKNNPTYDSRDNCNAIIITEKNDMIYCTKNSTIPSSVTKLSTLYMFDNEINIPDNIKTIGNNVMMMGRDKTIIFGSGLETIEKQAFCYCYNITMYF